MSNFTEMPNVCWEINDYSSRRTQRRVSPILMFGELKYRLSFHATVVKSCYKLYLTLERLGSCENLKSCKLEIHTSVFNDTSLQKTANWDLKFQECTIWSEYAYRLPEEIARSRSVVFLVRFGRPPEGFRTKFYSSGKLNDFVRTDLVTLCPFGSALGLLEALGLWTAAGTGNVILVISFR